MFRCIAGEQEEESFVRLTSVRLAIAGALVCAALSGCVVAPAPAYGEVVYQAPPPLRYELIDVAPVPGYFWIGGGWFWEGGHYGWRPGYWQAPRPGYQWVPHEWVRAGGGWRSRGGGWVVR
jgi:hypothetical protein